TLTALRDSGVRMAAVTSRSRITSLATLELAGLMPYLGAVVSAEDAEAVKPHPAPLLRALKLLGADPEGGAIAGDTRHDVNAGQAIGLLTVAATYGFHGDDVLASRPDRVIGSIAE